jgi:hypothetical protein
MTSYVNTSYYLMNNFGYYCCPALWTHFLSRVTRKMKQSSDLGARRLRSHTSEILDRQEIHKRKIGLSFHAIITGWPTPEQSRWSCVSQWTPLHVLSLSTCTWLRYHIQSCHLLLVLDWDIISDHVICYFKPGLVEQPLTRRSSLWFSQVHFPNRRFGHSLRCIFCIFSYDFVFIYL